MPRSAWAGLGALAAALVAQASSRPCLAAGRLGRGRISSSGQPASGSWPGPPRARSAIVATTAGATIIALRLALAALVQPVTGPVALPAGAVDWTATVASVSAPAGATQRAVVEATAADAGVSLRLWLLLPRYPDVVPGDRIHFRALATPPPEDDPGFAGYLAGIGASGTAAPAEVDLLAPTGGPAAALEQAAPCDGGLAGDGPARTPGRARRGPPARPARPRPTRRQRRLHRGRAEPRDRHRRLEGGPRGGAHRGARATPPAPPTRRGAGLRDHRRTRSWPGPARASCAPP